MTAANGETKDLLDELALIDCDRRLLRNARLEQEIKTQVAERKIQLSLAWRRELRTDFILLFALVTVIAEIFLSAVPRRHALVVGVLILAGWAIRTSNAACSGTRGPTR